MDSQMGCTATEGNSLSTQPRGRHRAAKHAAPKKPLLPAKAGNTLLGLAGLGAITLTGGSSIAGSHGDNQSNLIAEPTNTANVGKINAALSNEISIRSYANRAKAASRSDARLSLDDTAALDLASSNPQVGAAASADSTLDENEARALQALAGSSEELDKLVSEAQQQASTAASRAASEAAAAQATNAAEAAAAAEKAAREEAAGKRIVPIIGDYYLTARFGQRSGLWSRGWHTGLDFRVKVGTGVRAAASGKIIKAGYAGAYGNRIEVDLGDGIVVSYNHLSKIIVDSGWVNAGDEIALSGNTGHTTGPHLHFEVTKDGDFINPATWLWGSTR